MLRELTWREQQLNWFIEPSIIQQDYDLIKYIKDNQLMYAILHGDNFFSQYIKVVETGTVDFVIWIEKQSFDFDQLIVNINNVINCRLNNGGVLYLALNKYQAQARKYDIKLSQDYDVAIKEYLEKNINATIEQYLPNYNSTGTQLNWVHPLTRFYFKK